MGGGERYGLEKREKWQKNVKEKGEISERRKAKWVKKKRRKDSEKSS